MNQSLILAPGLLHGLSSRESISTSNKSCPFASFGTALTSILGVKSAGGSAPKGTREPWGTKTGAGAGRGSSGSVRGGAGDPSVVGRGDREGIGVAGVRERISQWVKEGERQPGVHF